MKAWVLHSKQDIRYEEINLPTLRDGEVLVEVKAAGICGSDIPRIYRDGAHKMPLVLGHECSGKVVKLGKWVEESWLHKRVGVYPLLPCRVCVPCRRGYFEMCRNYSYIGSRQNGAFAEYVAVSVQNLMELPDSVSYEQAAMLEPMSVAVHAIRQAKVKQTDSVVVYGLGTIGLLTVMALLEKGVTQVLAVGNKKFQKEKAMAFGLPEDAFCDSRNEDVPVWVKERTNGEGADVVLECVGKSETISSSIQVAAPKGCVCVVGNPHTDISLEKEVYWKILRNQLCVTGTWNSKFFRPEYEEPDGSMCERELSDWEYVLYKLKEGRFSPEVCISHRFSLKELEQGLHMMRDKTEEYMKVMILKEL